MGFARVFIPSAKKNVKCASIKDIARLASVSRALQNSPLVNAATAEKIRRVAADAVTGPARLRAV
jgi:hypothetical protein